MTNLPLISIVTPSYNQAQFIEATIRSVLEQDYPAVEQIVVDGGSSDGTLQILERYREQIRYVSEEDEGQADAINKGLEMAQGEIVAYLNSDDIYLPGTLSRVANYFVNHPEVDMIFGDCQVIDQEGVVIGYMPGHPFSQKRLVQRAEFVPQQAAFWRKRVHDKAGRFDVDLHYAMDYDFFARVGACCRVRYLPTPLACFRMHGASKTVSQEDRHWREALAVSERYGLSPWQPWYWIRRLRHWGLRILPSTLQGWIRRRLARPQDPYLYTQERRTPS